MFSTHKVPVVFICGGGGVGCGEMSIILHSVHTQLVLKLQINLKPQSKLEIVHCHGTNKCLTTQAMFSENLPKANEIHVKIM